MKSENYAKGKNSRHRREKLSPLVREIRGSGWGKMYWI